MAFRYRCGECRFHTGWSTESQVEDSAVAHYAECHPHLLPGGSVEVNRKNPDSLGCLPMIGIALLLILIIASCEY
ncbi:hypothetical protein [Streptomyces bacillaris]|uniref:hypothetical protein n=1 Tax=Streptomyces bacillaris TaxID=68179 RepID=UPI00345F97FF